MTENLKETRIASKFTSLNKESQNRHFLVVENNADDALLIRMAFQAANCGTSFVCRNASEARAYLRGAGMYEDRSKYPLPDAIITDYRMEGESGLDLVRWLKAEPSLAQIPTILLSGSASPKELQEVADLQIYGVYRKPGRHEDLRPLLQQIALNLCGLAEKPKIEGDFARNERSGKD